MNIQIRQEVTTDFENVFSVVEAAFKTMPMSDGTEQFLVERLRLSEAFIPELSLVAEMDKKIVGHILISKVNINSSNQTFSALSLAPVSVLPEYQKMGIGGKLIRAAHDQAKKLGHQVIVLIGHKTYYPRFGYQQADLFGIEFPFNVPKEHCMAVELTPGALQQIHGTVKYPKAFFEVSS